MKLKDINNIVSQPKVSVITATYKRQESLKKAILSIVNQSYEEIELIIIDDNGDEKMNMQVSEIVEANKGRLKHDVILITNSENIGSAASRNKGIEIATGEYITFLDDDDFYLDKKIEHQVAHMVNKGSDFSITNLDLFDSDGVLVGKRVHDRRIETMTTEELLAHHFMYLLTGTDTLMFKTKYLKEIGMFSSIDVGDEFYLMEKAIIGGGKISFLPRCDVKAFVHSNNSIGLSSGDGKIAGEKKLFKYKMTRQEIFTPKQLRFIKMRHYAVVSYAHLRKKDYVNFLFTGTRSFIVSPLQCSDYLVNMLIKKER